jgi:hypothetical protein
VTTHLTHGGDAPAPGDEEEPELVLIDDDEFEAAHRDDFEEEDEYDSDDEAESAFSFEEDLDEAIALDMSDEMDPTVEEADERMAPLFDSQRELPDRSAEPVESDESAPGDGAAARGAVAAALAAPALSKKDAKAEEKRQREALKRRKEIDKAASQDEKERQRDEKAQAVAAEREAQAAQKETAEAEKREAAEAKKQAAEDKKQAAEDLKRAAAEAKVRQAEEKAEQKAEAERSRAEAKQSRAEAKRKAKRKVKRQEDRIVPAGLTSFVVDEQPQPAATQTRKDARLQKQGTTRAPIVVMIVVLLLVAGIGAYATTRSSPKASPGRTAHVNGLPAALASMVSASTADLAYAQHIGGPNPASVNGGGSVDLAAQGSNLSVTYSMHGQRFPEQIVYDGARAFYDLGAIVRYVTPSYYWVSTDLSSGGPGSPGLGLGGVLADPSALVSLVEASAPSAREVGRVQLNGVATTEYSIALDQAAVTHLLASSGLPAYVHTATYTHLDELVYVDGSGRVARIAASGSYPQSGRTVTASTTLDLSHYGTPVSVAPPPPPLSVSEQQFQASADRLAHAPTP